MQILAPATGWDPAETDLLAALENVRQESCPRDLARDFLVAVTVRFQVLFVFLVMEVGSRCILHYNVTAHPTLTGHGSSSGKPFPVTMVISS